MKINEKLLAESINNHFTDAEIASLARDVLNSYFDAEANISDFDLSIEEEIEATIYWKSYQWALIAYYFNPNDGATWSDARCEFSAELTQVIQDALIETEEFEEIEEGK